MEKGVGQSVVLFAALWFASRGSVVYGAKHMSSSKRELLVQEKLMLLNKPAVKSIQSEDGDIIDCVDIYKQPAFDDPRLKNHKIKTPSFDILSKAKEGREDSSEEVTQLWQKSGSCPGGTVPIRRVQRHHSLNAKNLERYGRKNSRDIRRHEPRALNRSYILGIENLHSPVVMFTSGYAFTGARGIVNIWNPAVAEDDEYTTGQISLQNGPFDNYDSIELGWIVNPKVYGDRRTRFFAYWTKDAGRTTGCYDLLCPGFVQTNHQIALGAALSPTSTTNGDQKIIPFEVNLDLQSEAWWLIFNGITLGYWDARSFTNMYSSASIIGWGGDVYSPRDGVSPATDMGSGAFADAGYRVASYVREPRVRTSNGDYQYPKPLTIYATAMNCYSGKFITVVEGGEPWFFFGGPGQSLRCR